MSFLWPQLLWLMLAVPLLPLLYLWLLHRRRKRAMRYSSLGVVRAAADDRIWRRHIPPALLLVACSVLLFTAARPTVRVTLPWSRTTVMLAIDVSLSMRVADVKPSRMVAAQEAAKLFLRQLPRSIDVALVTFAGNAQVVQPATGDRAALADAIDAIQMQYGTAIGDAIVLCVAELFPDDGIDLSEITFGPGQSQKPRNRLAKEKQPQAAKQPGPVKPGSYQSAAIILLTDGRRTQGYDTLEAAKMAADRGVRIDVIGLGVVEGAVSGVDGLPIYMRLDEPTLQEVARMTGGEYHHAGDAETLASVYEHLGTRRQTESRETELAPLLAIAGAVLVLAAVSLSFAWFGRVA
jgi:Ca-activated chloride channel family protein